MNAIELISTTRGAKFKVALQGVRIRAHVAGFAQKTTIEQTFANLEKKPIEAIYNFPLPANAAVCAFEIITDDRILTGKIDEAETAAENYQAAIEGGHAAFMATQVRPDVFTVNVGNLKPAQQVTVSITYIAKLERHEKSMRMAIPTTIAPRYVTASGMNPVDAMIDGDAMNPMRAWVVPYGFELQLEIDLGRDLGNVHSPTHAIHSTESSSHSRVITLATGLAEMNRDIVIVMDLVEEQAPTVQRTIAPDGATYLAVTFVPEFDETLTPDSPPSETIFVLDCSGSMQGDSIWQARRALELCLRSLSAHDTFNICRFGSTFEMFKREPVSYSQETLRQAIAYVRAEAYLGGTELLEPLQQLLAGEPTRGACRQIVLLTDGQISNEPAVLKLARDRAAANRIFSFGIGNACSRSLVEGIARATHGATEFVGEGEAIEPKVLRTFGRITSPAIRDVAIGYGDTEAELAGDIPPVFDGEVMSVFARLSGKVPELITLNGKSAHGPVSWTVKVPPGASADQGVIAAMWAREKIGALEDQLQGSQRFSSKDSRSPLVTQLVALSKEFNMLTSRTAFIAIEHRSIEERTQGLPAQRRVPIAMPRGWGARDMAANRRFYASARTEDCSVMPPLPPASRAPFGLHFPSLSAPIRSLNQVIRGIFNSVPPLIPDSQQQQLLELLSRQNADGSFNGNDVAELLNSCGLDVQQACAKLQSFASRAKASEQSQLVQTLAVLLVLQHSYAALKDQWKRAEKKARQYVELKVGEKLGVVVDLVAV
ncbi:MAG: VWA domain-containing protein [Chloroflexi bacterium]|nr:VWA domain-containing protein [Chloroflexota bacterium]